MFLFSLVGISSNAQTFTGDSDGISFSVSGNWTGGVPVNDGTADIFIKDNPSGSLGFDSGGNFTANSVTVQNSVVTPMSFTTAVNETLSLGSGGLTNSSNSLLTLSLGFILVGNANFNLGTGGLSVTTPMNLLTNTASVTSGAFTLASTTGTQLQIDGLSTFGAISGSGSLATDGDLTLSFGSTFSAGDSFDLFSVSGLSGNFDSVSFSGAYTLSLTQSGNDWIGSTLDGVDWVYSSTSGTLSAIPEPSSLALAGLAGAFGLMMRRRRR